MPDKKYQATIIDNNTHIERFEKFDATSMMEAAGIADLLFKPHEQIVRIELIDPPPPKSTDSSL